MKQPSVSVIVPCYNGGRFLDGLLESLKTQVFQDFEIIIVDDGSTEPATKDRLASLDASIRVVRQENRGLPSARNTGFRAAKAAYVLPLDCDDRLEPTFLAETYTALTQARPGIGFVFTHMRLVGGMEGVMPRAFNRFDQLLLNNLPYCMLIKKEAWEQVGGYDETMRDGYEDWEFNIRLAGAGYHGIEIAKPLFIYRISDEGMLLSRSARMHGVLWRQVRDRHVDLYGIQALLDMHYAWRLAPRRFGFLTSLLMLAGAWLLPDRVVGWLFYISLRVAHWYRELRGRYSEARYRDYLARSEKGAGATGLRGKVTYFRTFISVALIATTLYFIGSGKILEQIGQINLSATILALALFLLQVLVVAWRFQTVLRIGAANVPFIRALEATSLSLIANFVLFTNLAGLVFRIVALRNSAFSIRSLIVASLIERLVVFVVLLMMAALSVVWLNIQIAWRPSFLIVCAAIGVLVAVTILVGLAFRQMPNVSKYVREEFARVAADIKVYARHPGGIAALFAITFLSHAIFLAASFVVAFGIGVDLTIYDIGAAVSATMLLASLPITVSGWGVRELSLVWLLGYLGIPAPTAFAFSVIIGILALLAAAVTGAVSTVIENLRRSDVRAT